MKCDSSQIYSVKNKKISMKKWKEHFIIKKPIVVHSLIQITTLASVPILTYTLTKLHYLSNTYEHICRIRTTRYTATFKTNLKPINTF